MNDEDLITIGQRIGYSDTPAELFGIGPSNGHRCTVWGAGRSQTACH
jgi:hypothetical protein